MLGSEAGGHEGAFLWGEEVGCLRGVGEEEDANETNEGSGGTFDYHNPAPDVSHNQYHRSPILRS